MKLCPFPGLALLLFAACQRPAPPADDAAAGLLITAAAAGEPMTVDGRLDEPAYARAQLIYLRNSMTTEPVADSAYVTTVQALYDDNYLYLGYHCRDRNIHSRFTERDEHLWEEEAVEVFIDVDDASPSTYVEIEVSPRNVLYDSYIVDTANIDVPATKAFDLTGIRTAVTVDGTVNDSTDVDRAWTVEMAIPLAELIEGHTPEKTGSYEWRINFYRINQDKEGPKYCAWSPTQGRFHKPERFGRIVFR